MVTRAERMALGKMMFQSAGEIIERTQLPQARSVWEHLMKYGCFIEPLPSVPGRFNRNLIERFDGGSLVVSPTVLNVMPFYAEDAALDPLLTRQWQNPNLGANYEPLVNLITVRADRVDTPYVMGCRLLHEGNHSWRAFRENRIGKRSRALQPLLQEEVAVVTFEGRLWREGNPAAFDKVIGTLFNRIERQFRAARKGSQPELILKKDDALLACLDPWLGTPANEERRKGRWKFLALYATLEYVGQNCPHPSQVKEEFMLNFYREVHPDMVKAAGL